MKWWKFPIFFVLGIGFAVVLTKAQVLSYIRVRRMFAFTEPHMYLVIGSAVATALLGTLLLKAFRKKDIGGEAFKIKERPFKPGIIGGGLIFGVGWYFTTSCPGPIYTLIGNGEWTALFILGGAIVGTLLFSILRPVLKD